ncbi:hypothetical protein TNCV_15081 [Trichonephila clavipes]|nr:hypothetical protein TNCV_15081 [Trichonephila clavipes]
MKIPAMLTTWKQCGRVLQIIHLPQLSGAQLRTNENQPFENNIESFLPSMMEQNPNLRFQQEGPAALTDRQTMELLRETFGKRPDFKKFRIP